MPRPTRSPSTNEPRAAPASRSKPRAAAPKPAARAAPKPSSPSKRAERTRAPKTPRRGTRMEGTVAERVRFALAELERAGEPTVRETMGPRYGLHVSKAFGVPMAKTQALAKQLGRDHALAHALWKTGWYEARLLTAYVAEVEHLTGDEMDAWVRDFSDWGTCDTLCFTLFDRAPNALEKISAWAKLEGEFQRRAGFALLAGVALHRKKEADEPFLRLLPLCERAASDGRNFVKKAVSWALRSIGNRNHTLHAAVLDSSRRLARSDDAPKRWVGKDVVRDLERPLVAQRLARKAEKPRAKAKH